MPLAEWIDQSEGPDGENDLVVVNKVKLRNFLDTLF